MYKIIKKELSLNKFEVIKTICQNHFQVDNKTVNSFKAIRKLCFNKYHNTQYDIIYYDYDLSYIELEKKTFYHHHLVNYERIPLTKEELLTIFTYHLENLLLPIKPLLLELINLIIDSKIKPTKIIEYNQMIFDYTLGHTYIVLNNNYKESKDIHNFTNINMKFKTFTNKALLCIAYENYLSSTITSLFEKELSINIV